jgi:PilZ domain-containing protein
MTSGSHPSSHLRFSDACQPIQTSVTFLQQLSKLPSNCRPSNDSAVTDRRASIRFEVMGRLPGTITAQRTAVLRDISPGGALIETNWLVPQDALLVLRLESETHRAALEARVRRVWHDFGDVYKVGLQFTAEGAAEELTRLIPRSSPS